MKSTYYFLIKPKGERYNNTKKIGDKELILNTEIFNHEYISRQGEVVGLPTNFKTPIKEGDEVIVHHNVFRRWHNARGQEKNSSSYIEEDLYKISIDQVFAYKRDDEWIALPEYTFVKPAGDLIGEVVYSDGGLDFEFLDFFSSQFLKFGVLRGIISNELIFFQRLRDFLILSIGCDDFLEF